jgi:hypothetical protein
MARRAQRPRSRRRQPTQLGIVFHTWGGRREGAGRRPGTIRITPHARRPKLASRFPVHVTLRVEDALPSLRTPALCRVLERCFAAGREGEGFRLVHYSVQRHHLHLLVEAANAGRLTAGIRGLSIRVARSLNGALCRRGRVFADRYFARILRSPRQVHHVLRYVLLNARKHSLQRRSGMQRRDGVQRKSGVQRQRVFDRTWIDPCSSGQYFDGWRSIPPALPGRGATVAAPRSWLLRIGWRRHGLIQPHDTPGEA